jgi:uncharacterized protein YukE
MAFNADQVVNIDFGSAEEMIGRFTGETGKLQEQIGRTRSVIGGVGRDIWDGGRRDEFDDWFQNKFLPAARDAADVLLPGMGSALSSMLGVMGGADSEMASMAQGLFDEFKF